MSSANINELRTAVGRVAQVDLVTQNPDAELISFTKLNATAHSPNLTTEDDAAEIGKGHEFAENVYPVNWDVSGSLDKYLSSQFVAWATAFCFGNVVTSTPEAGAYKHTCAMRDFTTAGIDMPSFTYAQKLRSSPNSVIDEAMIGCVISDLTLTLGSGPGRANSKLVVNFVGTGKHARPSGISAFPTAQTENALLSSGLTAITINGENYVTNKNIISLEMSLRNNPRLDSGFHPGSGTQDAAAIRGRMEYGNREISLRFSARMTKDSTERAKLAAQNEGTCSLVITGAALALASNHKLEITGHRTRFSMAEVGEADGLVSINGEIKFLMHSSNGIITVATTTNLATVG